MCSRFLIDELVPGSVKSACSLYPGILREATRHKMRVVGAQTTQVVITAQGRQVHAHPVSTSAPHHCPAENQNHSQIGGVAQPCSGMKRFRVHQKHFSLEVSTTCTCHTSELPLELPAHCWAVVLGDFWLGGADPAFLESLERALVGRLGGLCLCRYHLISLRVFRRAYTAPEGILSLWATFPSFVLLGLKKGKEWEGPRPVQTCLQRKCFKALSMDGACFSESTGHLCQGFQLDSGCAGWGGGWKPSTCSV